MEQMIFPAAPWCRSLKAMSAIGTIVIIGAGLVADRAVSESLHRGIDRRVLLVLPAVGIAISLLFLVTGYEIAGRSLQVRRLIWTSIVPLDDLESAWHDPKAMKGSIRVWGNGGLFSFSGLFDNRALGRYRVFVTDPAFAVVLSRRRGAVVISPADPQQFLRQLAFSFPRLRTQPPGMEV